MRTPLLVAALLLLAPAALAEEGGLTVDPPELAIGLFNHGADLHVRAHRPAGDRAVFWLLGPEEDVRLSVKDRVWGVLWTSVGDVSLHRVPALMLVHGGPELPPEAALARAGLTLASRKTGILGEDPSPVEELAFDEMLKLFEDRGTWAVRAAPSPEGKGVAGTVFHLPPEMPMGEFDLGVTFFAGERVVGEERGRLVVRRTGFVDGVIRLAEHHGLWYGLIAVVIATLAGLATGYLFSLRKKRKE